MVAAGAHDKTPIGSPGAALPQFVGRDAELAYLVDSLRSMPSGDGPVRLISGPAGIGKTRLARELSAVAEHDGVRVVWGHCWHDASAPPYWPWTQVVRQLLGHQSGTNLSRLVLDEPAAAERFELFDAVAEVLRNAIGDGPLLVALDDLHDADDPSLLLMRFLARQLRTQPWLVVGTHRPVSTEHPSELATHVESLSRLGGAVALSGLDADAVSVIVGGNQMGDRIHAVTGGNPLYIRQVIGSATWPTATVPSGATELDGLHEAVRVRIDALDHSARQVVRAAAVLGPQPGSGELAVLVGADQYRLGVGPATETGLLSRLASGSVELSHPLVGEAALDAMDPADRYELHRRAAQLSAKDAGRIGEHAHHLLNAGPEARAAAIDACRQGAAAASRELAHEEASVFYRKALAAMGESPDNDRQRLDLFLSLGNTTWRSSRPQEADEVYEAAWTTALAIGDPESLALAALRGGLRYNFTDQEVSPWAERTRTALDRQPPGESRLRALLLADLATHHLRPADLAVGQALATEALDMARRTGDVVAIGRALLAQQLTSLGPDTLDRRIDSAHEILECARISDDYRLRIHGRFMLMGALLERGDVRALDAELLAQHHIVDDLGEPRFARFVIWFRCTRALLDGNPDTAAKIAEECYETSVQVGDPDGAGVYGGQLGVARWMQGRIMEMEPLFVAMRAEDPHEPLWPAVLAWIWSDQGHLEAARGALAELPDPGSIPSTMHWLLTMTTAGEAAATVTDRALAATISSLLLPYRDRMVPVAMGAATWGTVARRLGVMALALGQVDEALDHLTAAVEISSRRGARPWLVEAQIELARALIIHRPSDPRIVGLLDEATATAEHLGLSMFVEQAAEAASWARSSVPTAEPRDPTVRSSSRPRRPSINVMGGFEVVQPDGSIARWNSRKARDLLKILVSRRGAPITRYELMDLLWPREKPERLANRLSVAISTVRRTLDPDRTTPVEIIEAVGDAVRLRTDAVDVDIERFLGASAPIVFASAGTAIDLDAALSALDLHRGEPLAADVHADWATSLRSEVRDRYVALARTVAKVSAEAGNLVAAADAHRRILDVDPYDEPANLGRVATLRSMGSHGQADAAYDTYVERMHQLGVPAAADPSAT